MVLHHCELPVEYDRRHVDERLDEVFRRVQKKAEEAEGTVTTPVASKHSEAHSLLRFQNGSMSLIEEDGDAITKRRQPQGGKAQSEKGKAAREYLASVPHIIQMLKQHHLDENGYVGNPEAMGFNKIVERLELNYSKGKKNHVTKFFEKEFTKRGSLKGWQLYANAFAGSGNESTLLKWLKHVDKSAADAIIESADETVAEAADEPPEGDTSKCECGQPLLPGDKLWGECAACRQPEYK
ncbi:MAG: hypothetical protein KDA93_06355 [Planctomycetaceae bacterium]|nr:hypothetical protein [Planctomycetaceae bacterium]